MGFTAASVQATVAKVGGARGFRAGGSRTCGGGTTRIITLDLHKRINYPLDMMTPTDNASATATVDLPQRKVKKGILDVFRNLRAITSREGGLLPFARTVAALANGSRPPSRLVMARRLRKTSRMPFFTFRCGRSTVAAADALSAGVTTSKG